VARLFIFNELQFVLVNSRGGRGVSRLASLGTKDEGRVRAAPSSVAASQRDRQPPAPRARASRPQTNHTNKCIQMQSTHHHPSCSAREAQATQIDTQSDFAICTYMHIKHIHSSRSNGPVYELRWTSGTSAQ